jgi:hypothetical protein
LTFAEVAVAETGGLMLLRAGVVTQEQLARANQSRREHGGTLGGHLVALGLVTEDQLAEFYRHRLMVPRIGQDALASIAKKVIAIVPSDMAAEFRVVPVSVDREGNLTLAMADPSDTHAVDEVGFFTGHFVMRAVTTESAIAWALEHYYSIATAAIPAAGAAAAAPAVAPAPSSPAAPIPAEAREGEVVLLTQRKAPAAAPPAAKAEAAAEAEAAARAEAEAKAEAAATAEAAARAAAEAEAAAMAEAAAKAEAAAEAEAAARAAAAAAEAEAAAAATAAATAAAEAAAAATAPPTATEVVVEPATAADAAQAPVLLGRPTAPPPAAPAAPAPVALAAEEGVTLVQVELSLSGRVAAVTTPDAPAESPAGQALTRAIRALREVSTPEGVAAALLDYFGSFCDRTAFFTVRKGHLHCDQARGPDVTAAAPDFDASVDDPSVFREVIASRFPYRGALGDSPAAAALREGLLPPGADDVVLLPVAVRHRVVSLAYGDRLTGEPSEAGMTRVALEAGIAYERLIASRKGKG